MPKWRVYVRSERERKAESWKLKNWLKLSSMRRLAHLSCMSCQHMPLSPHPPPYTLPQPVPLMCAIVRRFLLGILFVLYYRRCLPLPAAAWRCCRCFLLHYINTDKVPWYIISMHTQRAAGLSCLLGRLAGWLPGWIADTCGQPLQPPQAL